MTEKHKPSRPYLLFHPQFIAKHENDPSCYEIEEAILDTGIFKEPSFAIDINCRQFLLKDVVKRRTAYAWWNLPFVRRNKIIYVDYLFEPPQQLGFGQARDAFVEYVCAHRWWSSSHETQEQFRARNAGYTCMADLMRPVSLKGNLPRAKRKR